MQRNNVNSFINCFPHRSGTETIFCFTNTYAEQEVKLATQWVCLVRSSDVSVISPCLCCSINNTETTLGGMLRRTIPDLEKQADRPQMSTSRALLKLIMMFWKKTHCGGIWSKLEPMTANPEFQTDKKPSTFFCQGTQLFTIVISHSNRLPSASTPFFFIVNHLHPFTLQVSHLCDFCGDKLWSKKLNCETEDVHIVLEQREQWYKQTGSIQYKVTELEHSYCVESDLFLTI